MNNLISIIIPTYNRAQTLREAILSVLDQSGGNWELIIIDDGSNDGTFKVIEDFLADVRIHYHFQKNSGVSAARNKGIELSRGNYIIFLDSDDKFLPGLISRLYEVDFVKYDLICWQVSKMVDGETSIWKPRKLEKIYHHITATFLAGSICYKKEILKAVGGFDPKMSFGENYELGMRIAAKENLEIKILDQQFLFYSIEKNKRECNNMVNRLKSLQHLYSKHQRKYQKDKKSHGQIKYLMGYMNEKLGMKADAKKNYVSSFKIYPLSFKPFLKIIYLHLF